MNTVYVYVELNGGPNRLTYGDYINRGEVGEVKVFTNVSAVKLFAREQVEKLFAPDHPGRDERFYANEVEWWIKRNIREVETTE